MITAAVSGLLAGLSLIVAIGAQNAYLLRQGLRRSHVGPVAAVCIASDWVLISAGVAGIGALAASAAWALTAARWLGAAFLTWYAVTTAWRARRPAAAGLQAQPGPGPGAGGEGRGAAVRRAVALTWLNPHVYLDTVLLLGSVAAAHGSSGRWWFAAGACLASTAWFAALGYGARLASPLLASPRAWQVLDLLIAATMAVIAVRLATM